MIEGYMKFYSTGVLVNVGAVNPCVKSKTNHLHANTGVRKTISDSRTLHWLTQVATVLLQTVCTKRQAGSGYKLFDTPTRVFFKVDFEKEISRRQKHAKLPRGQRLKKIIPINCSRLNLVLYKYFETQKALLGRTSLLSGPCFFMWQLHQMRCMKPCL